MQWRKFLLIYNGGNIILKKNTSTRRTEEEFSHFPQDVDGHAVLAFCQAFGFVRDQRIVEKGEDKPRSVYVEFVKIQGADTLLSTKVQEMNGKRVEIE